MIIPPSILIVFLILGLTYLQRPRVAPLAESTLPSTRGSIRIKINPPLNEINQTHQTDQIDQTDQTDQINQIDQRDETNQIAHPKSLSLIAKSGTSITAPKILPRAVSETSKVKPKEIDQTQETDQIDQTNQTYVPKDRKASPLLAKAKKSPNVRKPLPSASNFSKINQTNQTDETDQIDEIDEINEINQTDEIDQIDQIDQINQTAQLKPPPLIGKEEEVKQLFAHYRERYAQRDIEGFLSLFSSEAVQNGRDGFDDIKKIYSDFFDQSQKLRYRMEDTRIDIYQNAVHVRARYKVDQILKKGRRKKVWRGDIRWILVRENGALRIRFLDFKPQKSR